MGTGFFRCDWIVEFCRYSLVKNRFQSRCYFHHIAPHNNALLCATFDFLTATQCIVYLKNCFRSALSFSSRDCFFLAALRKANGASMRKSSNVKNLR